MDVYEAARELSAMNAKAPYKEKTISLILFGIKYGDEISSISMTELQDIAQIPKVNGQGTRASVDIEVKQGIRLSQYVQLRDDTPDWL